MRQQLRILFAILIIVTLLFAFVSRDSGKTLAADNNWQLIESDDEQVSKSGDWTFQTTASASGGGYLHSNTPDDILTLEFIGTAIEVVYVAHPSFGTLAIEVDGEVLRTVITTRSEVLFEQTATIDYLEDGSHVLRVYPVDGTIAIDAFRAQSFQKTQSGVATAICDSVTSIPKTECEALVTLYNNTDGDNWTNNSGWLVDTDPCNWNGVNCAAGHVSQLFLGTNNLSGTLPDLNPLSNLQYLFLSNNQLTGSIPDLSSLTNLEFLYLRNNQLTGTIPDLNSLTNLAVAGLDSNKLTGNIPDLSSLTSLQELYLNNNQLTGTIPDLSSLTALVVLDISNNALAGDVPTTFANLVTLLSLDIGYNKLTASDPVVISFLNSSDPDWDDTQTIAPSNVSASAASDLDVDVTWDAILYTADGGYYEVNYSTTAGAPYDHPGCTTADKTINTCQVSNLNSGTYYFAVRTFTPAHGDQQNDLTSSWSEEASATVVGFCDAVTSIPQTECESLISLYRTTDGDNWSDNTAWLVDTDPCNWFGVGCSVGQVSSLNLNSNNLSGSVPTLSALDNLDTLDLAGNQLAGNLSALADLTTLTTLNISNNALDSDVPSAFTGLVNLSSLDIGYNKLTASAPGVVSFLDTEDPDWDETQTIAPSNVTAMAVSGSEVDVAWDTIPYTGDGGYYEVNYSTSSGGPYDQAGCTTADKTINSCQVSGLTDGITYYFAVRTFTPTHGIQPNNLTSDWSQEASVILIQELSLTAPAGDVTTRTPTFVWEEGTPMEWYQLYVREPGQSPQIYQWYQVGTSIDCVGGTCSIDPGVLLGNLVGDTAMEWYLQPYSAATGIGSWVGPLSFTIIAPVQISPADDATVTSPTSEVKLEWNAHGSANWYQVYIAGPGYTYWEWHSATSLGCTTICTLTTQALPANGDYTWYIASQSTDGDSPWSVGRSFTLNSGTPGLVTGRLPADGATLTDADVTFSWDDNGDTSEYHLYFDGPADSSPVGFYIVNAEDVCNGTTCAETVSLDTNGTWNWYIAGYNAAGYGPWGDPNFGVMNFTLTVPAPGLIAKTAPLQGANLTSGQVTFGWQEDANAVQYETYISGPNGFTDYQSWDSNEVCVAGSCGVDILLPENGDYTWYLHGIGQTQAGPWGTDEANGDYGGVLFTVAAGLPSQVVKTAPLGGTLTTLPILFQWQADANATSYRLYVDGPGLVHDVTYPESEICVADACEVPVMPTNNGVYAWYLQGISAADAGPWGPDDAGGDYGEVTFTLNASAPATDYATLISPTDDSVVGSDPVAFEWQSVNNASWYNLILADGSTGVEISNTWYMAESADCLTGGICTVDRDLDSGNYRWSVRTWSAGASEIPTYAPDVTPTFRFSKLES